jgi:hypothetical protein
MPSGTTYYPQHPQDLETSKLASSSVGLTGTCTAGGSQNLDLLLTNDVLVIGGQKLISGAAWGDTIAFQVVDTTGFTGVPAGTVLSTIASSWYVPAGDSVSEFIPPVYKKLIAGLTIRMVYNSVGGSNVNFSINYDLLNTLI